MAKAFQRAETVICTITIKTAAGVLTDPATSIKIDIVNPIGVSAVTATAMTKDSTGNYHYDYSPTADAVLGPYRIKYTATDGTRVTIQADSFTLE
jgi:uncharacterized protein YfaS (alpha-2-macroglobulin family)